MNARHAPVTVLQASQDSPSLSRLLALQHESSLRWQAVSSLIPEHLRSGIQAGPIRDNHTWCLLLDNSHVAAKVRQLVPALRDRLKAQGFQVEAIQVKVRRRTEV